MATLDVRSGISLARVAAVLGAVSMAVSWLIPNHYPPWTSFYNNACMGLALVLFVMSNPSRSEGMPVTAVFIMGVAVVPWLQWAGGLLLYAGDAWISTVYLLGLAAAIGIASGWASAGDRFVVLISSATLFAACCSALIAITQIFLGDALGIWGHVTRPGMRADANLAQPNNLATLIGMGAVGLLALRELDYLGKISGVCILFVLITGAALTQSRTALIFGLVIYGAMLVWSRRAQSCKTRPATVLVATAGQWLLTFAWPAVQKELLLTQTRSLTERSLTSGRYEAWQMFIGAADVAPWTGWGWSQSAVAQYSVAEQYPNVGSLFAEAHNLFLDLIVWCGYPIGLFISFAVLYWYVSRLLRLLTVQALCAWTTVAILGVHSMVEPAYYYAYFVIPAGLWIGVVESSIASRRLVPAACSKAIAVALMVLFVFIVREYRNIERDFRDVRFQYLRIGLIHRVRAPPANSLLSNLMDYLRFYRTAPDGSLDSNSLARRLAVVKRYPYAPMLSAYAQTLALANRSTEGRDIFLKIRSIYGERGYAAMRSDLIAKAQEQEPGLKALVEALPEPIAKQKAPP